MNVTGQDAGIAAAVVAAIWTIYQFAASRQRALHDKINESAQNCVRTHIAPVEASLVSLRDSVSSQHRETMLILSEMEKRLPKSEQVNAHDNRIGRAESRIDDLRAEIDELARRVRKIELSCASQHSIEDSEIPISYNPPPRPQP